MNLTVHARDQLLKAIAQKEMEYMICDTLFIILVRLNSGMRFSKTKSLKLIDIIFD